MWPIEISVHTKMIFTRLKNQSKAIRESKIIRHPGGGSVKA